MGSVDFSASLSFDAIVSRCWDSIIWQAKFVSKLKESLQKLTTSLKELMFIKNDVKTRVEDAEQQPFIKRLEQVQGWILRVETIETEVHEVVKDSNQEIEKLCCGGFCSKNYISSYRYGRKVAKMLVQVDVLKSKGFFQEVAQRLPGASVDEKPIEPTVGMDLMLDKVWSYIKDDQVGIIGIYGMGGVGKTTLLTQINNSFLHTHNDFNLVIWVLVSKDLKLDSIQDQIGEKIGFSNDAWKQKAQHQKFLDIYRVLSKKKFVLLLDDVWKRVEITEVGVPIPDNQNKSKIIFTTRSMDVCGEMDAHKKIKVEFLAWDQAWNLFQNKVGEETLLLDPDIPELAKTVAKECGGLPLAIITIGRAMACKKTPQEWKHAIQVLKDSASEFSGMRDKVFRLLKFSYDNLPSEKIKSCFLYCALFPEGFLIFKDQLLYFWMCEGILDKIGNVEEAQNECYHILSILLNACLLEEHDKSRVKMHDISRDMALWLACESEKTNKCFLVQAGANLIEVPNVEKWKNVKRVSLMSNHIKNLDAPPESRNLLTLFLGKNHLNKIVKSFFDFMPTLQILDLSNNKDLTQLPCGVSNLVTLQYLNLAGTGIRELPIELKNLVSLKFLDLESVNNLNFVPLHMISSFSSLKVLKMLDCGYFKEKAMLEVLRTVFETATLIDFEPKNYLLFREIILLP